eukprot:3306007-Rhodomonas_salina.1
MAVSMSSGPFCRGLPSPPGPDPGDTVRASRRLRVVAARVGLGVALPGRRPGQLRLAPAGPGPLATSSCDSD